MHHLCSVALSFSLSPSLSLLPSHPCFLRPKIAEFCNQISIVATAVRAERKHDVLLYLYRIPLDIRVADPNGPTIEFAPRMDSSDAAGCLCLCVALSRIPYMDLGKIQKSWRTLASFSSSDRTDLWLHLLRELTEMMTAKFSDSLPPPPCPHLDLIYATKLTQPPLLRPPFHDPLPFL